MSQWHASLETLPSREGAKRSTKVESRDDERALVKESRTRRGGDKEQQGANGRAITARIRTGTNPHSSGQAWPHKSMTTNTAVAVRGYRTERESRIDDNWKVIIQKRWTTTKEKIAVSCLAKILWSRMTKAS